MGCPPCVATAGPHRETGSRTQAPRRDSPPMTTCLHPASSPALPAWPAWHGPGPLPARPPPGAPSAAAQPAEPATPLPAAPCTPRQAWSPLPYPAAARTADPLIWATARTRWAPASVAVSPATREAQPRIMPVALRLSRAWSQSSGRSCAGRGLSTRQV